MTPNTLKTTILGTGAWGTAIACVMARSGHSVTMWGRDAVACQEIERDHTNLKYLPSIKLVANIQTTTNMNLACRDAEIIFIVTPAQTTADVCDQLKSQVPEEAILITCSKGIDRESLKNPSQVAASILPKNDVAALSGPSFATDVAKGLPTAVTLAHDDIEIALQLAAKLSDKSFRIYASDDRLGTELGGALKNIIAIAVGIVRGLGLGASAEAALIARGFAEMSRLAIFLGARQETLMGLSGFGDLVLSCSSVQSRNFQYGVAIGEGRDLNGLPLAEGAKTVFMAASLARQHNIACPIIETTELLVDGKVSCAEAIESILSRPLRIER